MLAPLLPFLLATAHAVEHRPIAPGWVLDRWTRADGLPVDHLNDVAVDGQGTVWLATFDGLVRFDGATFEVLRASDPGGPPSTRVAFVRAHPGDGALWLTTEESVLQRRAADGITTFDDPAWRTFTILDAGAEALWAATASGVARLTDRPERIDLGLPHERARLGIRNADGGVWVADETGAWWTAAPDGSVEKTGVVPRSRPVRDAATGELRFLLPGSQAMTAWRGGRLVAESTPARSDRGPPVPSRWGGVGTDVVTRDGLPFVDLDAPVVELAEDGDAVWIATKGGALVRLRPVPVVAHRGPDGAPTNVQRLWWEAATETLWAHGEVQGWWPVRTFGGAPPALPPVPAGYPAWTPRYFTWPDGRRGVAYADFVLREAPGGGWTEDVPPARGRGGPVWHVGGAMWLGGDESALAVYRDGAWAAVQTAEGLLMDVLALVDLPDGSLVVGANDGLWRIAAGATRAERVDRAAPLGAVRHLRRDEGRLWIATVDRGLCVAPIDGLADTAARCLASASTLGRATVHASVEDVAERVWVSSNQGVGVLARDALRAWADGGEEPGVLWLGEADGMLHAEGNGFLGDAAVRTPDGRIWFATQDGALEVDAPGFASPAPPAVYLREARVGERVVAAPASLAFPEDPGPVRVQWTTGATPWVDQLEFRYRLAEDAPWSAPTRERQVEIATLAPGRQRFAVQARLGGAWGDAAELTIERAPTLTERPAFPFVVALAAGLATFGVVGVRNRVLAGLNRRLTARIEVQTRDLAERNAALDAANHALGAQNELLAAQARRLADADEARRQLIANVSHELRTPLSLVLAPLGALRQEAVPGSKSARNLALALDGVERLDALIGQLFDLARADAGALQLRARRHDLAALLVDARERFGVLAASQGGTLELTVPDAPVPVWLDRDLVDKVLTNLVANALKHGGAAVHLRLVATDAEARVEVEDRGPGVREADRATIFERFRQGEGAAPGGAGLGLSLCRTLVELHGGRIGVEPADPGARFWFVLPRGVAHLDPAEVDLRAVRAPAPPLATPPLAALPAAAPGRPRVLLVEDHEPLRAYLAELLAERFDVAAAANGEAALAQLRAAPFDAVVTDIMMPVMDGNTLVRRIRADPRLEALPVLIISARGELQDRIDGLGHADDYLAKPFQGPELVARLVALLRRSHPTDGPLTFPAALGDAERDALLARLTAAARLRDPDFGANELARAVGMSLRSLQLQMQEHALPPPGEWLRDLRVARAEAMIRGREAGSVSEIADAVGMSRSYFTRVYTAVTGRSPGEDLKRP